MKKIITFFCLIFSSSFAFAQLQFLDDFENYTAGQQLACQNPAEWTTWNLIPCDSVEDPYISTAQAFGGTNSVLVSLGNDPVKRFTYFSSTINFIFFQVYIPSNKTGYFDVLTVFEPPSNFELGLECYFDPGGQGKLYTGIAGLNPTNFNFEYDTWMMIRIIIRIDFGDSYFWLNEDLVHSWDWTDGGILPDQLAAIDFYGFSTPEMYIDNFFYQYDYCLSCPPPNPPGNVTARTFINPNPIVQLIWQDNSDDEYIFEILRKDGTISNPSDFELISIVSLDATTFLDSTVTEDSTYTYGIRAYSVYGYSDTSNFATITVSPVTNNDQINNPLLFSLSQNYPNPFNPTTSLQYAIGRRHFVSLKAYDVLGNEVVTLVNEEKPAGEYEVEFNASELPSGIYFYTLRAGEYIQTRKMVFLR